MDAVELLGVFLSEDQRILRWEVRWGESIPVAFTAVLSRFLTHSLPNKNHQDGINWAQATVVALPFKQLSFVKALRSTDTPLTAL